MKKLFLLAAAGLFQCSTPANLEATKASLMQVDREFSDLSAEKGMKYAFLEYAAPEAILLRPNRMPLVGKEVLNAYFGSIDDSNFRLTWEPIAAEASASADMGFTYGTYLFATDSSSQKGTYVSIWKKGKDGRWKYCLDAGNEGIGQQ